MDLGDIILSVAIMVGQSLLMLVALLIFIAYALYADRKVWAAVQLRRGPNVVGPWGLLQSFADLLQPFQPMGAVVLETAGWVAHSRSVARQHLDDLVRLNEFRHEVQRREVVGQVAVRMSDHGRAAAQHHVHR